MPIYRFFLSLLFIPIAITLLGRLLAKKESFREMLARFGLSSATCKQPAPSLWLHAASNGELNSAKAFLEKLRETKTDNSIIITCNTVSGIKLAKSFGYRALLAPLDYWWSVQMFRRTENISQHITMESEIWPNRFAMLHKKKIKIAVLGARLSAQTSKTWSKFPQLAASTIAKIDFLSAQNLESLQRFQKFGLADSAIGSIVNLKSFIVQPQHIPARSARANTCLAASTHPGEDEMIIDGFSSVRDQWPLLKLILAPRHPHRAKDIKNLLSKRDLTFVCRSQSDAVSPSEYDVLLADTLGEMDLWYKQSGICIIGGSFKHSGGHTPYEPAAYECALIHGPFTDNFKGEYETLTINSASLIAKSAQGVCDHLLRLKNPANQENLAMSAKDALAQGSNLDSLMKDVVSAVQSAKSI